MRTFNKTAILWTKKDIDVLFQNAQSAIKESIEETWNVLDIRSAVSDLDTLAGVLEMLQLHTATTLIKAIREGLIRISLSKNAQVDSSSSSDVHLLNDDETFRLRQAIVQGLIQFPDLMEYLSEGHKDIPELVLPLVNEIKDVLKEKRVQPSYLFAPDTSVDMAFLESNPEYQNNDAYKKRCEYMSSLFQGGLLQWVKGDENPFALELFINTCEQMTQNALNNDVRKLFFVAQKCFEAFHHESLPCSIHWKHALAKLDKVIKSSSVHGHQLPLEDSLVVRELLHQLLYFVAFEGSKSAVLEEVVMLFGLDDFIYNEEDLQLAQAMLAGRNQQLMNIVSSGLKEEIMAVKDGLDMYLRTSELAQLSNQADRLEKINLTLGMLDLAEEAQTAIEQKHALEHVVQLIGQGASADVIREHLTEIASEVLGIDAGISNKVADVHHDNTATTQKLQESLINETMVNLNKAKHAIIRFSETKDSSHLQDLPKWIEGSSSALMVMSDFTAHEYFEKMYELVEHHVSTSYAFSEQDILALANIIVCLDYYLEATRDKQPDPYRILEVARENFLHFGKHWDPLSTMKVPSMEGQVSSDLSASALGHELISENDRKPAPSMLETSVFVAPDTTSQDRPSPPVVQLVPRRGRKIDPFDGATDPSMIDDEIKEIFAEEMQEEIASLKEWLPLLSTKYDRDVAFNVRKSFHTVKGSGRMIGAKTLGEIAWRGEMVLNKVLESQRPYSTHVHHLVLKGLEMFEQFVVATTEEKEMYWEDEAFFHWADSLAQGQELAFDAFSKAPRPDQHPDHVFSSVESSPNVVALGQPIPKTSLSMTEEEVQTLSAPVFSPEFDLTPVALPSDTSSSSASMDQPSTSASPSEDVRWDGLDLDLNREFSLDAAVVDQAMEEEHGWNLDAISLVPQDESEQEVISTPPSAPAVTLSDEAVASDDALSQGSATPMHTPEPRPTFDFSNLSLELVDNDAPASSATPSVPAEPVSAQPAPAQTLLPEPLPELSVSSSTPSLELDLVDSSSDFNDLGDLSFTEASASSLDFVLEEPKDQVGAVPDTQETFVLSDSPVDFGNDFSLELELDTSSSDSESSFAPVVDQSATPVIAQEFSFGDLNAQDGMKLDFDLVASDAHLQAQDVAPASTEPSLALSVSDEVSNEFGSPQPPSVVPPAVVPPAVVPEEVAPQAVAPQSVVSQAIPASLMPLPALVALPVTKPAKEDWKEYASILVENNQTLNTWLEQIEEADAKQDNAPLRDFCDHLMGLQKRNVHLMNKLMAQVMELESDVIKKEMKEMLKTVAPASVGVPKSASVEPSAPPTSVDVPASTARVAPAQPVQSASGASPAPQAPVRPQPPRPAFKATQPVPQKAPSFWSRLFKKK